MSNVPASHIRKALPKVESKSILDLLREAGWKMHRHQKHSHPFIEPYDEYEFHRGNERVFIETEGGGPAYRRAYHFPDPAKEATVYGFTRKAELLEVLT